MKCIGYCMICTNYRINIQQCRYDKCTYTMCSRCVGVYSKTTINNLCPACRREDAFEQRHCLPSPGRCTKCCLREECGQTMHITLCVTGCILCFGTLVSIGGILFHALFPTTCCENFVEFFGFGFLICFFVSAFFTCGGSED